MSLELNDARQMELATIRAAGVFDTEWYSEQYPDVNELGIEPDAHYVWIGALLGRDPGPKFNTRFYLEQYRDVAESGLNPLFHFVSSGLSEGRRPVPASDHLPQVTQRSTPHRIEAYAEIGREQDWLLFAAYSPDGHLSACQVHQLSTLKCAGYHIALILSSGNIAISPQATKKLCDIVIVRGNIGFDFGAWRHAIEILGGLPDARSVTFTNDSILPVLNAGGLMRLRLLIDRASADVVFMTDNNEIRPHSQSYFFSFAKTALGNGALDVIESVPYFAEKETLIQEAEIALSDRLRSLGHSTQTLFQLKGAERNPTIHHWEALIDEGLPFLKIQLVTAGILDINDIRLKDRIGGDVHDWLRKHCYGRTQPISRQNVGNDLTSGMAATTGTRFNEHGAQQAFNLDPGQNPTIYVPVRDLGKMDRYPKILTMLHAFYVDVAETILCQLAELAIPMRVVVTTDTKEKAQILNNIIRKLGLTGEIVQVPNRGRDVAPLLIEGAKLAGDAELVLHLHTKKSPHDPIYAGWGQFLYSNLIGSREIVWSIIKIMQETGVGFVYSDHFPPVVDLRNWGYDFLKARELLAGLGLRLSADDVLEFPTSSMFWARREALEPLFGAELCYDQFDREEGQIDGTLAHAIERVFLYVAQLAGFSCAKVTSLEAPSEPASTLLRLSCRDLPSTLDRPARYLLGDSTVRSAFQQAVPEIYPVSVARSRNKKRRLTAILPTMQPEKIYGGITTAIKVIEQLRDALAPETSIRFLITSDEVNSASVREITNRLKRNFVLAMPDDDVEGNTIVGLAQHQHVPISLRSLETYVATAWWTADLGFRLLDRQRDMHGRSSTLAYVIQDFEPGFYKWSNKYALAEATYRRPKETIAIINSEELTNYILARYQFDQAFCVPYELNANLAELIKPSEPHPIILVYGRPSVDRNCFELICEGLRIWEARSPDKNSEVEIIFAGEEFDPHHLPRLSNVRNAGKLSLQEYASLLNHSAVGISLMVSPHPSYPPLEMASAGCLTITNRFEDKDLALRAENIISLDPLTPHCLADCIDRALALVVYKQKKQLRGIKRLDTEIREVDFEFIARRMVENR